MPRSRNIKPGFFANDALAELPPLVRLLFAGIWTIADREGRLDDRPKRIKAQILPYDEIDVDQALDQLADGSDPFVARYEVDGTPYIAILAWPKHQNPHKNEASSVIPSCEHHVSTIHAPDKNSSTPRSGVKGIRLKESVISNQPDEHEAEQLDRIEDTGLRGAVSEWLDYKRERREGYKTTGLKGVVTVAQTLASQHGEEAVAGDIRQCIASGYKGFGHGFRGGTNGRSRDGGDEYLKLRKGK